MFRHRGSCVWRQHVRPLALWSPKGWRWWAGLARRATWRHKISDEDNVQWATYLPVWTQLTPTTQNWPQLMNDEMMTQPTERLTSCIEICSRLCSLTTQHHSHQCADTERPYTVDVDINGYCTILRSILKNIELTFNLSLHFGQQKSQ